MTLKPYLSPRIGAAEGFKKERQRYFSQGDRRKEWSSLPARKKDGNLYYLAASDQIRSELLLSYKQQHPCLGGMLGDVLITYA